MSGIAIRVNISSSHLPDYQATSPVGYFFLFGGGYPEVGGAVGSHPVSRREGPAGLLDVAHEHASWTIEVNDLTGEGFRLVQWHLVSACDPAALSFDPPPDRDLPATEVLTIDARRVPEALRRQIRGYWVTLENRAGTRLTLDPRYYDTGPDRTRSA